MTQDQAVEQIIKIFDEYVDSNFPNNAWAHNPSIKVNVVRTIRGLLSTLEEYPKKHA